MYVNLISNRYINNRYEVFYSHSKQLSSTLRLYSKFGVVSADIFQNFLKLIPKYFPTLLLLFLEPLILVIKFLLCSIQI